MSQKGMLILESKGMIPGLRNRAQQSWSKLYKTNAYLLDIHYSCQVEKTELSGQILTLEGMTFENAGHVSLINLENRIVAMTRLDRFGYFLLTPKSKGRHQLMVEMRGSGIMVSDIVLD
ncbi:MAG: hypothetical protein KC422_04910 [Trueperaceae bacterium]|nr:hypothetical protein [Trueperaceae bacterium]